MVDVNRINIVLVDDHEVVRKGLSAYLDMTNEIRIVGEASNGEEAVDVCIRKKPDVILIDITMPKMDGIEVTRIIHSEFPFIRIIGLSIHDKQDQAASS